eukprot:NODE_6637_length_550_cov_28.556886_g6217_i0.p1 GENE.NODE_6637_length_550_cov_28.556886_g6217_i0~~NODE_6637_length_550_cov_28.556886_g6217_i0.p1  ORF type:complete len:108 (-),score=14.22 NODE_6637_length_550_cov_28.556886_g6217_i0:137-460(-)
MDWTRLIEMQYGYHLAFLQESEIVSSCLLPFDLLVCLFLKTTTIFPRRKYIGRGYEFIHQPTLRQQYPLKRGRFSARQNGELRKITNHARMLVGYFTASLESARSCL